MAATAKLDLILELKNKLSAGFGKARQYLNSELKGMKSEAVQALSAIKDEIPGVARAVALLANPYALAAAGAVALGAATYKSIDMAMDWRKQMAEVNVTAQLSKSELKGLSDRLLDIGSKGSNELAQVPQAFNRIISAGLSVNQSLEALEPTLKAAKAGFTDIETVAAAGIGVMKSSGENINTVYDVLFATLNKGNAKFQDIAQYLPKIIPGARQAGFALQETAGAWAYLTAQGQSAEQSTTGLMNAFKALSNPEIIYGGKSKGGFKALGVDIFDATGKMRPLIEIVSDLSTKMQGLTDEQRIKKFSSIGLDMEAAGAFASMTQNVNELKGTIDFTTNSAGQLNEAVKNSATGSEGWASAMNKVKRIAIDFGGLFLPLIDKIGSGANYFMSKIQEGINWFKELYNQSVLLQDVVGYLGDLISRPFRWIWFWFTSVVEMWKWINSKLGIIDSVVTAFKQIELMWIGLKATAAGVMNVFSNLWTIIEPLGNAIANMTNPKAFAAAIVEARNALGNFNFSDSFNKGFNDSLKESLARKNSLAPAILPDAVSGAGTPPPASKSGEGEGSGSGVKVNAGTPQKYININVEALHKGDNILKQDGASEGMTLIEFERMMNEVFLRLLRNSNSAF